MKSVLDILLLVTKIYFPNKILRLHPKKGINFKIWRKTWPSNSFYIVKDIKLKVIFYSIKKTFLISIFLLFLLRIPDMVKFTEFYIGKEFRKLFSLKE
jgi:hypothetical protein